MQFTAEIIVGKKGPALNVSDAVRRWLSQRTGETVNVIAWGEDDPPPRSKLDVALGRSVRDLMLALLKALPNRRGPATAAGLVAELAAERDKWRRKATRKQHPQSRRGR